MQQDQDLLIQYLQTINDELNETDIYSIISKPKMVFTCNQNLIPPFSLPKIKELTDNILVINKQFESEESRVMKDNILKSLQAVVTKWSIDIAEKEKQIYKDQLQHCAAVLIPYGSSLIGVNSQESDLDVICVAPAFLDRKTHFFKGLYELLEVQPYVTKINKIESSVNPIIKLYYKGSSVDINFAQLNRDTIPKDIDAELDDLRRTILHTEKPSIDALNGRKNGLMIRQSVQNEKQFIDALRIIKLWSKKRGISSNMIGYLGGISWAILVAKICQMFPNLNGHQTVYMFFKIYTLWDWQKYNVVIDQEDNINQFADQSWATQQKSVVLMKILTPASPYINSAAKVNLISFKALGTEFSRGLQILQDESLDQVKMWEVFFQQFDLFEEYKYFLTLSIVSNNPSEFYKWSGYCESQLVSLFENVSEYLYYGNMKQKPGEEFNEYQVLDETFSTARDKFELRISSNGIENQETDFKSSYTYHIGMKKTDLSAWPLFLIVPISKFAEKINKNKLKSKFSTDDNMKIYFQTIADYIQQLQQQGEDQSRKNSNQPEEEVHPRKKVKLEQCPNSAELIKRMSSDHQLFDNAILSKTLDDMF